MESVLPSPATATNQGIEQGMKQDVIIGQDLPEPTGYRGQYVVPLDIGDDAWLSFYGVNYWLDPIKDGLDTACAVSLISEDDALDLTCAVYSENGDQIPLSDGFPDPRNPTAKSFNIILKQLPPDSPVDGGDNAPWQILVPGTSLTFRLNYKNSQNVKDVIIPLELGEPLVTALNKRRLCFRLKKQPTFTTKLVEEDARRPEPKTPLIYLHGYEDPDTSRETIGTRVPPFALTHDRIIAAWQTAKATGYFDPAVFPNVATGGDDTVRTAVMRAIAGLDDATVVQQISSGARLVVSRSETGDYTYRFLPAPEHCTPGLVLVENYRLTSFPARYGAGRTIKTFSLLPGERTTIRVSTYKRSSESQQKTASILDATNSETENEFARTVNSEQSDQQNAGKSFEYRAEAEAEGKANWGWGSASAKVSGGVAGSSNSTREEFSKNLSNAVNQNTARASSRREMQVDTSIDVKLEQGEEAAVERTLQNINVSRTLNFVFRQINQEYVVVLHLVDVRVAFFNGHAESRDEAPLADLDRLLGACLLPDRIPAVRAGILRELKSINDRLGRPQPDFVIWVPGTAATSTGSSTGTGAGTGTPQGPVMDPSSADSVAYTRVNPEFTSSYTGPDGVEHTVPGIIVAADQRVLRTDGIVVDSFLGDGDALDTYSTGLQTQAVRGRAADNEATEINNQLRQVEADRLRLALQIVSDNDAERAALFQDLFVRQQIVNQIDHAAVNGQLSTLQPVGLDLPGGTTAIDPQAGTNGQTDTMPTA